MKIQSLAVTAFIITIGVTGPVISRAAEPNDEINLLKKQIQELDQKVRVLERNRELETEAAETKKLEAPKLTAGQDGFSFSSADTNFALKLRGYVQADGRYYIKDHIPV